ncbi:hypothetical protein BS50DRAFT_680153 [Corynespora cassiicola Philippines]|uniref:Polynucleotide 5'-hydroxyl-kinase GRC3 n=1 Tax=Corynespora cassiicola Philippines TaxID=1448308 RepID=A0A2T2NBJ7_CORCC|nr:hypothetical protein BS50DRAFT_680153 [Corynespora cassiicola Philippines]
MAVKRRRVEVESVKTEITTKVENGPAKPMSAIAAARLKAAQVSNVDVAQEIVPPSSPLPEAPESDYEESEPEPEEEEHVPDVHQNFKLCNWRADEKNILKNTDKELSVVLNKHSTISLIGYFDFKVTKGAVNINGANIGAKGQTAHVYRAYVPSTHPITKIRGLDGSNHIQFLQCEEPTPFAKISPLFTDIWNARRTDGKQRSFDVITESDTDPLKRPLTPEVTPEEWHRAVEDISATGSTASTIVLGSSGKSTLARRLLNRYLTGFGKTAQPLSAAYYLDLDPSKPEYSPQGQISLVLVKEVNLGPSFTHPCTLPNRPAQNQTLKAHVMPSSTLINFEEHFNSCAEDLFQTYQNHRSQQPSTPLIINTSTTLSTTHFPLLQHFISRTKPAHIIHLGEAESTDTTAPMLDTLSLLASKTSSTTHILPSISPLAPPSRSPTDLTSMQTLSYFHLNNLPSSSSSSTASQNFTWDPKPLSHLPPWDLSYRQTPTRTQDFTAILTLHPSTPPSHLLAALNGSVVHLLRTPTPATPLPRTQKHGLPYFPLDRATGLVPLPDPRTSALVCAALVRGYDTARGMLEVIVPRAVEGVLYGVEGERTAVVVGAGEVAEWAFVEDAYLAVSGGREGECGPWVEKKGVMSGMGYLGTVRRVRKFL